MFPNHEVLGVLLVLFNECGIWSTAEGTVQAPKFHLDSRMTFTPVMVLIMRNRMPNLCVEISVGHV